MATPLERYQAAKDGDAKSAALWSDFVSDLPPKQSRIVRTDAALYVFMKASDGTTIRTVVYDTVDARTGGGGSK